MLLGYHLRLAAKSIARDRWFSLAMVVGFALPVATWSLMGALSMRIDSRGVRLLPTLHNVAMAPRGPDLEAERGPFSLLSRTRVSYPAYRILASSGIPTRQTGSARSTVLVRGEQPGAVARPYPARFASADFFGMFGWGFREGEAFSRATEARGEPVLVLGDRMARVLFDGSAVGHTVWIDGRAYRVVGVLEGDSPNRVEWDLGNIESDQDALFLPFAELERLRVRPYLATSTMLAQPTFDDLLASDLPFVNFWVDLPSPAARQKFAAYIDAAHLPVEVRSASEWLQEFRFSESGYMFFGLMGAMILGGASFAFARLFLAKGVARRGEMGVHRALGATRSILFRRLLVEAALLAAAGIALASLVGFGVYALFAHLVPENDVPTRLTAWAALGTFGPAFVLTMIAAALPAWRLARQPATAQLGTR